MILNLLYIPILLKINVGKHFFIHGGLLGDIDVSKPKGISDQSGIGTSIGVGTEFYLGRKISLQLNPYMNFHGLIMSNPDNYPDRVMNPGIKLSFLLNK